MKIIFLDIDGVLNSDSWDNSEEQKQSQFPENQFSPKLIQLFNKVIEETTDKIVLTSTWRLEYDIKFMQSLFKKVGIKGEIIDFTPDLKKGNDYVVRGNEILKWCKDNQNLINSRPLDYTDFIIIDDNSDMLFWQSKFFFQTDRLSGLTPSIIKNIIRQFKN
jgi:hypothetical protein